MDNGYQRINGRRVYLQSIPNGDKYTCTVCRQPAKVAVLELDFTANPDIWFWCKDCKDKGGAYS